MQLIDYNDPAVWQALYDLDAELDAVVDRPHVRLSYHRAVMRPLMREMAEACMTRLGWQPSQKIVVAGCAFGWMIEILRDEYGFMNITGVDPSRHINLHKEKTEEAEIEAAIRKVGLDPSHSEGARVKSRLFDGGPRSRVSILNEDALTSQSRSRIRKAVNAEIEIVLTEHVLEAWSDADCLDISAALHQLAPNVQHFVGIVDHRKIDERFQAANWKATLEEWKALLPNDTFISVGDYKVL